MYKWSRFEFGASWATSLDVEKALPQCKHCTIFLFVTCISCTHSLSHLRAERNVLRTAHKCAAPSVGRRALLIIVTAASAAVAKGLQQRGNATHRLASFTMLFVARTAARRPSASARQEWPVACFV